MSRGCEFRCAVRAVRCLNNGLKFIRHGGVPSTPTEKAARGPPMAQYVGTVVWFNNARVRLPQTRGWGSLRSLQFDCLRRVQIPEGRGIRGVRHRPRTEGLPGRQSEPTEIPDMRPTAGPKLFRRVYRNGTFGSICLSCYVTAPQEA